MPVRISLCMIVKDEAETLARCLRGLAEVVDEMVIVDTGSSDQTAEIALAHGARLERRPWQDDFGLTRNESLALATGDWILVLDADEQLDPRDRSRLRSLCEEAEGQPEGYLLRMINHLGAEGETAPENHASLRLFRNRPAHRFSGTIHEQVSVPEPRLSDIRIHHWGYLPETYANRGKAERNERLLEKALLRRPEDPFLLYSLAVLRYATERYPEARALMERAVGVIEPSRHYHSRALKILAMAEAKTNGPAAAQTVVNTAVTVYPDFTDLYLLRSGYRREIGDVRGAVRDACECLVRGEAPSRYDSHSGVGGSLPLSCLVELLPKSGASRAVVFEALAVAAGRALAGGDPVLAERCFAVGYEEARRVKSRLRGRAAKSAGQLLAGYVRHLWTSATRELERGVKAAPWCEVLVEALVQPGLGLAPPGPDFASGLGPAPPGPGFASGLGPAPPGPEPAPGPIGCPTIALCVIVRDEAASLRRSLLSARDNVDEMVVVDTGSSDESAEVAANLGAAVHRFDWTGSFSEARNFGLERTTADWVLQLDADEELAPGHGEQLRAVIATHPEADGFLLRIVDYLGDHPGLDRAANLSFRLFRNRPEHRFTRDLHEQLTPASLKRNGRSAVYGCPIVIRHYGYLDPVDRLKKRSERNLTLARKEVATRPDPFSHFNLAAEYLKTGQYPEALRHYRETIEKVDPGLAYAAEARLRAAVTLALLGVQADAVAELVEAEADYPTFTDLFFLKGEILRSQGRLVEAGEAFRHCLELGEASSDFPTLLGVGTYRAANGLGEVYEAMGSPRRALACYAQALALERRYVQAHLGRARVLLLLLGDRARERFQEELASLGTSGLRLNLIAGYVWLLLRRPEWALTDLVEARSGLGTLGDATPDEIQAGDEKAKSLLGLCLFELGRDEEAAVHLAASGKEAPLAALSMALLLAFQVSEARLVAEERASGLKSLLLSALVSRFEASPSSPSETETQSDPIAIGLAAAYSEAPVTYVELTLEIVSLAAVRRHEKLLAAALSLMRPVEDLGPWLWLGKLYHKVGLEAMAAVELADCLERGVTDAEGASILAGHLIAAGRGAEGERLLRETLARDPGAWRAWLTLWNWRRQVALDTAKEAARLLPDQSAVAQALEESERLFSGELRSVP